MITKSKNKQGISLIVLIITIIVMIILAATIILTLSNNGIFDKASEAVEKTNSNEVKNLAQLLWSEERINLLKENNIKPEQMQNKLETAVMTGLTKAGIDTTKYIITVTIEGVDVQLNETGIETDMNKWGFYYDRVYMGETEEESMSKIGWIFRQDGSVECYMADATRGDDMYLLQYATGLTYSQNAASYLGNTITFSQNGTIATIDGMTFALTSFQVRGIYTEKMYASIDSTACNFQLSEQNQGKLIINGESYILNSPEIIGDRQGIGFTNTGITNLNTLSIRVSIDGTSIFIEELNVVLKLVEDKNQHGFYFDRLYVSPEGELRRGAYVLRSDGTIEFYEMPQSLNSVFYAMFEVKGISYDTNKAIKDEDTLNFSENGGICTLHESLGDGTYEDINLTLTAIPIHGIYVGQTYSNEQYSFVFNEQKQGHFTLQNGSESQTVIFTSAEVKAHDHLLSLDGSNNDELKTLTIGVSVDGKHLIINNSIILTLRGTEQ